LKLRCYHPVAILRYWQRLRRQLRIQQVMLKCYDYFLNLFGLRRMAPNGGVGHAAPIRPSPPREAAHAASRPTYRAPRGHAEYLRRQRGRAVPTRVWTTTPDGTTYVSPPPANHRTPRPAPRLDPVLQSALLRRRRPSRPTGARPDVVLARPDTVLQSALLRRRRPSRPAAVRPFNDLTSAQVCAFVSIGEEYIASFSPRERQDIPNWVIQSFKAFLVLSSRSHRRNDC
jgi:hypothetical protein